MFVRKQSVRRGERTYHYLKLVENAYVDGRAVQSTLLNLGNTDKWSQEKLKRAVLTLSAFVGLQWNQLEQVSVEKPRQLGPYLALGQVWDDLGLDQLITEALHERSIGLPVARFVRAMVFHRLMDPRSKLQVHRSMAERVFIPGLEPSEMPLHGYYRALQYLHGVSRPLEKALYDRTRNLFNRDVSLVFYDLTSTCFEGKGCSLARYGYSRDHRPDLLQIQIGLLVDADGLPIGHEVFPGNMRDASTVLSSLERLGKDFEVRRCVFVGDDGMCTEDNLTQIAGRGYEYITSLPLRRSRVGTALLQRLPRRRDFTPVLDNLAVRELPAPAARAAQATQAAHGVRYIGAYNLERARANRCSRHGRLRDTLDALTVLADAARKDAARKTPRMRNVCKRALEIIARCHCQRFITLQTDESALAAGEPLTWRLDRRALRLERAQDGLTILCTNSTTLTTAEVALAYRELWRVEDAFRHLKDPIRLRPIRHWKDPRVLGHVLVCVLAYTLERLLEARLHKAGIPHTARAALDALASMCVVHLKLDTQQVRRRSEATPAQQQYLKAAGVEHVPLVW